MAKELHDAHEISVDPLQVKPGLSMGEILKLMHANDEGMLELSVAQMQELATAAEIKVDNYHYIITKYEAEAERLKAIAKEFAASAAAHANKAEMLKRIICYHMKEKKFTSIPGQHMKVSLRKSTSVALKVATPTEVHYVRYAPFMRIKYEWDKTEITKALKSSNSEVVATVAELASFEESNWPDFRVKGLKDE